MFLSTIVCSFCPFCFDHCIVCTLTCGFWLHLWYLLTIVLSVLWLTASDYTFGIFWPLYCLYFDLRLLITPLVSFDHCIVCTLTYSFWLHLCIVCTLMASVYTFGIFWPLYCLYFDGFCLHFWYLLTIVLSVLWLTASDYTFGIVWPLYCLYFDGFCLHLWHLLTIVLSVFWLTASDYTFGIFWPLYCLYFDLRLLITPLVSFDHCIVCTLMASVYTFGIFRTSLIMEAWHNHSENTLNSQQNSQTLQDLFDITIRYYQNSFDTWDDEQHWNLKKCSRHVMDISVHLYFIVLIVFCMYSIFNLL